MGNTNAAKGIRSVQGRECLAKGALPTTGDAYPAHMDDDDDLDFGPPTRAGEFPFLEDEEPLTLDDRKDQFLRYIGEGWLAREAADAVGMSKRGVYKWRDSPEFRKRWEKVKKIRLKNLKEEAARRAMRKSDKLLMFLLTNLAPDEFTSGTRQETPPPAPAPFNEQDAAARLAAILATAAERQRLGILPQEEAYGSPQRNLASPGGFPEDFDPDEFA